jgi:murein DD-endopeptidase MepM/ murein hydrolase activator NlpD
MNQIFKFVLVLLILLLSACTGYPSQPTPTLPLSTPSVSIQPTTVPTKTATFEPTLTPTPTKQSLNVCSPLKGLQINELPGIVSNPFQAPKPGHDDGHHGVDLAFYRHGDLLTMLGLPVQSILNGKIVAAITNRPPYGNFVIIETPLENIDLSGSTVQVLPTRAPTNIPDKALNCPVGADSFDPNSQQLSLFVLYAHLNHPTSLSVGDQVSCGQVISDVGTTGFSVNPHLHLETRIGPSGAGFSEMAHYINNASNQEMHNYCTWRISGVFQMFDPMILLSNNR